MCTVYFLPENLEASLATTETAQKQVDELMEMAGNMTDNHGVAGVYVWLDSGCYGNSIGRGYYYVRLHDPRTWFSTAYDAPALIVKKSKLRPDQIEFMERKRAETNAILAQG